MQVKCTAEHSSILLTCIKGLFAILLTCIKGLLVLKTIFTCIALGKAGLVRGPLRPSATLLRCLVCVICNSKSFHSFLFKLCIMIVHIL